MTNVSRTRRVWQTIPSNFSTAELGTLEAALLNAATAGTVSVREKDGAVTGTMALPLTEAACNLCARSNVETTLVKGEIVRVYRKAGVDQDVLVSGIARCQTHHFDKSAKVSETIKVAAPKASKKPTPKAPKAPVAKPKAQPAPVKPKASPVAAPKAPVASGIEATIAAAKAAGAMMVRLPDGTSIIF